MFYDFFGGGSIVRNKKDIEIENSLRDAFSKIKEEFNQHLDSINQNTDEINANFEHITELEAKIDKLDEKISDIQMELLQLKGVKKEDMKKYEKINLIKTEKEVFVLLYSNEELTFLQIARKLSLTKQLVERYISNLILKGIPVIKSYREDETFLSLDPHFKAQQAKENIVGLDSDTLREVL